MLIARWSVIAVVLIVGAELSPAFATCTANVSSSMAADGTVTVTGSGGGSCGSSALYFYLDDSPFALEMQTCTGSTTCQKTFTFSAICFKTGTHTVSLTVGCEKAGTSPEGNPTCDADSAGHASSSFTVDTTPQVSISYSGPDSAGNGTVTIPFEFKNTSIRAHHRVRFSIFDPLDPDHELLIQEQWFDDPNGTWTFPFSVACFRSGTYRLKATAVACGGLGAIDFPPDASYITAAFTSATVNRRPNVSATILPTSTDTSVDIGITYDFPHTNSSSQRLISVAWAPSPTSAGGPVTSFHPSSQTGSTPPPSISVARQENQETLLITATACGDESKTVAVAIPAAERTCCSASSVPASCVGHPVRVSNGNIRYVEHDPLPVGEFASELGRTYDSGNPYPSVFGAGWTSPFDAWLRVSEPYLFIGTAQNNRAIFERTGVSYRQVWPTDFLSQDTLADGATGTVSYRQGGADLVHTYRLSDGRLIGLRRLSTGREVQLAYDANGLPMTVTDTTGAWQWSIATNGSTGKITSIAVTGRPDIIWTYNYDGSGHLTSVLAPDNQPWRTYHYANGKLSEVDDPLGNVIESHRYDASGRAIDSVGADDSITNIQFGQPGRVADETVTIVTSATGRVSRYFQRYAGGRMRTVEVDGGCSSCGTNDAVYGYDAQGHLIREQDARGYLSVRLYDGTGKFVVLSGPWQPSGCNPATDTNHCRLTPDTIVSTGLDVTSATTVTTYAYADPSWPDVATTISTESVRGVPGQVRVESRTFAPDTGEVLVRTVTGWTGPDPAVSDTRVITTTRYNGTEGAVFDPCNGVTTGCAFSASWLTLPQPANLHKSVQTPRTDVTELQQSVWYPADSVVPALWRRRLAATRDAAGLVTRYENYDVFGNPGRIVEPNGVVTEVTYDALGRPLNTTTKAVSGCDTSADALCATDLTSSRSYFAGGGPLQTTTRAGGGTTTYGYDARGRVASVTRTIRQSPTMRERMEYTYDNATGRKTLERFLDDSSGTFVERRNESFAYDMFGRLTETTHADGTKIRYAYDAVDQVTSVQDERHLTPNTRYRYDAARRLSDVRQTLSSGEVVTSYAYDKQGNLTSVSDPNGNVTTYLYDDFGLMLRQTSTVTGTITYAYDRDGNLASTTDANGATTTRTYAPGGRVTSAVSTRSGRPTETVTWTYDDATAGKFGRGRLTSMTDPSGSTAYAYERRGLLRAETRTIGSATYATSYGYDVDGNRASVTYPTARVVTYGFDLAGRPSSASANGTSIVSSAEYLPFGPMTRLVFGNGTTRTTQYDSRYRPLENKLSTASATLADYTYENDPVGNITQIHDALDASWNRDFAYDDLNRLITANSGTSLWGSGSYAWDAMGNMTSLQLGTQRQATFSYSGGSPKLLSATENGVTRTVSYDAAGNEIAAGAVQSTISSRNFVIAAGGQEYEYDGRGVRTLTTAPPFTLSFASSHVTATQSVQGTITLVEAAPAGGYTVALSAPSPISVPATVIVAAGSLSATFTASAADVLADTTVTVTATHAAFTTQASLIVDRVPWRLVSLTFDPNSLCPDTPSGTGTVTLLTAAPTGGATVQLAWTTPRGTSTSSVVVAEAQTTGTFAISNIPPLYSCLQPPCTGTVSITAQLGAIVTESYTTSSDVCVEDIGFELTLPADPMASSREATGFVTLPAPAPRGGSDVLLRASDERLVRVPRRVHVAAGERRGAFRIATTESARANVVTIEASVGNRVRRGILHVASATGLRIDLPADAFAGSEVTGHVELRDPAAGGATVTLSADRAGTGLPQSVAIAPGATTGSFAWQIPADAEGAVKIVATLGSSRAAALVTVHRETVALQSFDLTLSSASGRLLGVVTLTGPAPMGGTVVTLTTDVPGLQIPTNLLIAEGATIGTFESALPTETAESLAVTASLHGQTLTASVTIARRPGRVRGHAGDPSRRFSFARRTPISLGLSADFSAPSSNTVSDVRRISLYTPELQLLAETVTSAATTPAIAYEYVWFAGQPVAQIESATNTRHYYFNDHLGAPILTTNATAAVDWRIEREPFGSRYTARVARYQPLAFPGQEDDPASDRSYNIFRWYRSGWGRYTQADPIYSYRTLRDEDTNLYLYAGASALRWTDRLGLFRWDPSCSRCSNPPLDPAYRSQLENDTASACQRLNDFITDRRLASCIRRSCGIATVECDENCPSRDNPTGGSPQVGAAETLPGGRWWPRRRTTLCLNGFNRVGNSGWGAVILIHEFAHGCGWDDLGRRGVPDPWTGASYDDEARRMAFTP